jgi:ADP-ribose pyrophosphatase YjhB (NUDIX family)
VIYLEFNYFEKYKRLLAIAEAGLYYGNDSFDQERYKELKEIALKLISHFGDEDIEKSQNVFSHSEGYPTPKVDVRAYIKKDNKFLLVEDIQTQEWSLPGGYAEIGLTPKENITKEVLEETGLNVDVNNLLAIFDTDLREDVPQVFQYYKMIFSCSIIDGSFQKNIETSRMDFFTLNDLPKLSLKRTTKEQLAILENTESVFVQYSFLE